MSAEHPGWTKPPTCSEDFPPLDRVIVQACLVGPGWKERVDYARIATPEDVERVKTAMAKPLNLIQAKLLPPYFHELAIAALRAMGFEVADNA